MSVALFRRGLKWRQEANERLEVRRKEILEAEGASMSFGLQGAASAADHVDSYWEYRRLVGESDGGTLLSEASYAELKQLAARAAKNRLYVTWRNMTSGMDCYCIGPDSRCFCGHSYKAHAWYNTESKKVFCRCADCRCEGFEYVTGHGAWWIKCTCKHAHTEHVNGRGACTHPGCDCAKFHSSFSCACGAPWSEHATVFETRSERAARGAPIHNLCGGGGLGEAACGALTRMSSLVPGIDRIETPLPFTDAGFFAHRLPSSSSDTSGSGGGSSSSCGRSGAGEEGGKLPSSQQLLDMLPDESLHLLLGLLEEPTAAEEEETAASRREAEDASAGAEAAGTQPLVRGGFGRAAVERSQPPAAAATTGAAASRAPGTGSSNAPSRTAAPPQRRSAILAAHDGALNEEIARLTARLEDVGTSAAAKHGLKKQIAAKRALLKRDVAALAGR